MHAAAVIQHTEQKAACLHGVDIAAGGVLLGQDLGCGAVGFQIVPEQAVPQADVERGKIGERLLQRLLEQRRVHSLAHHGCQAEYVGIAPARHHGKDIRGVVQLVPPRGCSAFFMEKIGSFNREDGNGRAALGQGGLRAAESGEGGGPGRMGGDAGKIRRKVKGRWPRRWPARPRDWGAGRRAGQIPFSCPRRRRCPRWERRGPAPRRRGLLQRSSG